MATLRIEKVNGTLPGVLSPNTLYYVKNGSIVESYISDETGSSAFKVTDSSMSGSGGTEQFHPFLLMGVNNG